MVRTNFVGTLEKQSKGYTSQANVFITTNKNHLRFAITFLPTNLLHFPQPRSTTNLLLSLQISVFWTFHRKEVLQYMVFCDWLLSQGPSVLLHTLIVASFFIAKYSFVWIQYILFIHQLMGIAVIFTFPYNRALKYIKQN